MAELSLDVRDHRGRLVRLAIAVAIGLGITLGVMELIAMASIEPNGDPVGSGSVAMLAIAVFVVATAFALAGVSRVARHLRR